MSEIRDIRKLTDLSLELLAQKPEWAGGERDQERLSALAGTLDRNLKSLDGRLVIGLLGGTGVGKSTLISALAGAPISPMGSVRPTTSQPVAYRHQSFPRLSGLAGREVIHHLDGLKDLAIVDFPDFDSVEAGHHRLVMDHMKDLDLLIWVASPDKYADRRLYDVMAEAAAWSPDAQAVILNKVDEFGDRPEEADEILSAFEYRLRDFGWRGGKPWPVSARAALAGQGDGGLAELWDLLASLKEAKARARVEEGNLAAAAGTLARKFSKAARPENWLERLGRLEQMGGRQELDRAIQADLAGLRLSAPSFVGPRLELLKDRLEGLLSLFTDLGDFARRVLRFKQPEQPAPPVAAAPLWATLLAGRRSDLAAAMQMGAPHPDDQSALLEKSQEVFANLLDEARIPDPPMPSWPLNVWPFFLMLLLLWVDAGGRYDPQAITSALLRSLAPWTILTLLGNFILTDFLWFRARRRLNRGFHLALAQTENELRRLADQYFYQPLAETIRRGQRNLDLLADILTLGNVPPTRMTAAP